MKACESTCPLDLEIKYIPYVTIIWYPNIFLINKYILDGKKQLVESAFQKKRESTIRISCITHCTNIYQIDTETMVLIMYQREFID